MVGKKSFNKLIYIFMLLGVLVTILIFVFVLLCSFMGNGEISEYYGMIKNGNNNMEYAVFHIIPNHFTLNQYVKTLWNTSDFWFYFWNSVFYSVPIMIGGVIVAVLGGYAFAKFRFPLRKMWLFIFITVMLLPYQVMIPLTLIALNAIGILNTRAAVILPNIFTAFGTYLLYQYIRTIPDSQIEAAKLDGAGKMKILVRIVLPQIKGGIVSFLILNFIDTWNLVEQPLMYLKSEFQYPLSAALSYFQSQGIGMQCVCVVVFLVPVMLAFLLGKDYIMDGIKNSVVEL